MYLTVHDCTSMSVWLRGGCSKNFVVKDILGQGTVSGVFSPGHLPALSRYNAEIRLRPKT